jgi:hypothetical protein
MPEIIVPVLRPRSVQGRLELALCPPIGLLPYLRLPRRHLKWDFCAGCQRFNRGKINPKSAD